MNRSSSALISVPSSGECRNSSPGSSSAAEMNADRALVHIARSNNEKDPVCAAKLVRFPKLMVRAIAANFARSAKL